MSVVVMSAAPPAPPNGAARLKADNIFGQEQTMLRRKPCRGNHPLHPNCINAFIAPTRADPYMLGPSRTNTSRLTFPAVPTRVHIRRGICRSI